MLGRSMKNLKNCLLYLLVLAILFACSDEKVAGGSTEDSGIVAITDKVVAGVSQKGPFVKGSQVRLYGFNIESMANSGQVFSGKISNEKGEFTVPGVNLPSQYAILEAQGFYRNEVSGLTSTSQINLYAVTDLRDRKNVNVNLLTHLEYERVLNLVSEGMSVVEAKKKAKQEILNTFYINYEIDDFEDLNIFNKGSGDAILLALSILLQGDRSEGDLSELLANYASDMEKDGTWDDEDTKASIADWTAAAYSIDKFNSVRHNIESWKLGDVADFEKFLNLYWWKNYGLGVCNAKRQNEVMKNQNALSANRDSYYICEDNLWNKTDYKE